MRAFRVALVAATAVVAAITFAGCGASARDQVQAKVEQFVQATAGHDYKTLCNQVLGPELLTRLSAGGIGCEQAMAISLGRVHAPIVSIGRITVDGSKAQVITLSGAAGEHGAFETIGLVNTSHGWRVTSLATPSVTSTQ
jgi:hypothetical protein